jgi:Na+/melibiose symporter-like transporter
VPSVVRREKLVEANSKLGASDSLAEIAGPPLGGVLVQIVSAPLAIVLDALSFVASALAIRGVQAEESQPKPAHDQPGMRREVAEGLAAVRERPALVMLLGVAVTQSLGGSFIGSLYDIYLIRELGLSPALVGMTIGIGGASALAGAFLAERVSRRLGLRATLIWTLVIGWATNALIPLASGSWALAFLIASQLSDVVGAVFMINALSLRQAVTPDRLLGRVNAGFNLLPIGAALLGALAAGALATPLGLHRSDCAGQWRSAL